MVMAVAVSCGRVRRRRGEPLTELQRVKAGALDVVLLSPHDALRHGKDTFVIEFRSERARSWTSAP